VANYHDRSQLPSHTEREIKRFFQDYKVLEHKTVEVEDFLGPADALAIIRDALELYRRLRRGEIGLTKTPG
jgi:inorganic pyrophosphatase